MPDPAEKKIKILKDGPYLVSGGVPLAIEVMVIGPDNEPEAWASVRAFAVPETYALCRCGRSGQKPFCDGVHTAIGFDGRESAARKDFADMAEKNPGPGLDLLDAACFCAIARFCHRAGDAWTLAERSDDPESRRIAVEEACNCPSGRLVAVDNNFDRPIEPAFPPSISLIEDPKHGVSGALWVKGGIPIEAADGFVYEIRNRVTLCRCGHSKNKPFCDGGHIRTKFKDGLG